MTEHLVDVALEHPIELRRDRAAHDQQGVDGEEWVAREPCNGMPPNEALTLQCLVCRLVLDPPQALGGRAIIGQLEHAAQQHRHVLELRAGAPLDLRNDDMRQVGIGAAEIEVEFHLGHDHQTSR